MTKGDKLSCTNFNMTEMDHLVKILDMNDIDIVNLSGFSHIV